MPALRSMRSALSASATKSGGRCHQRRGHPDFPDTNWPNRSADTRLSTSGSATPPDGQCAGKSVPTHATRINGVEAQATTGATDSSGGVNRGRGFDFNVFASELFNNITVRKTASAETEEGSLGATIDLRTTRPFDYKGFTSAASVQYGYNDLSQTWDPRAAVLISDTFAGGKFGVLASLAYSERNLFEDGYSSVRWDNGPAAKVSAAPSASRRRTGQQRRNGITAANCATGCPAQPKTATNNTAYTTPARRPTSTRAAAIRPADARRGAAGLHRRAAVPPHRTHTC